MSRLHSPSRRTIPSARTRQPAPGMRQHCTLSRKTPAEGPPTLAHTPSVRLQGGMDPWVLVSRAGLVDIVASQQPGYSQHCLDFSSPCLACRRDGGEEEDAGMEEWDQEQLEKAVKQKHGAEQVSRAARDVCGGSWPQGPLQTGHPPAQSASHLGLTKWLLPLAQQSLSCTGNQ